MKSLGQIVADVRSNRTIDDALGELWGARIHSGRCLSCGSAPSQTPEGRCHPCDGKHRDEFSAISEKDTPDAG